MAEKKEKFQVMLLLNKELDRLLDDLAKKAGESRSNIVRVALREYARKESA